MSKSSTAAATLTENSPLLPGSDVDSEILRGHNDVYHRFSARKKRIILAVVSWTGLIPAFASGSFVPSIPQIARDLNTTGPVVSLAVSFSIGGTALGSLTFAAYSTFYGRRPVYVYGLPIFCIGSLGVAMAQDVLQVMIWRLVQAVGSGSLSVGSAVIGDIYQLEERGTALGIFYGVCLLGPSLAPVAGGVAAHYYSWRHMQYALALYGLVALILVAFILPETSHPKSRGIDKYMEPSNAPPRPWKWVWINPFGCLWLLRSPTILAICLAGIAIVMTDYVLLIPLAYTIGKRYHITNEAVVGACFLPSGIGNAIGAPLAGRLSDQMVVSWRNRRGGKWVPEDRLRVTLSGAAFLVPLSVLFSGLLTQFVGGPVGLCLNLICLFINGFGVVLVLAPAAAYLVDIMHSRSAEVIAANLGFRYFLMSAAIPAIFPLLDAYGVAITNGISALLAWFGFLLLWCNVRYGEQMRSWSNVEYSTAENN